MLLKKINKYALKRDLLRVFLAGDLEGSFNFEVTIVDVVQESGGGGVNRGDSTKTFVISANVNEDVKVNIQKRKF